MDRALYRIAAAAKTGLSEISDGTYPRPRPPMISDVYKFVSRRPNQPIQF